MEQLFIKYILPIIDEKNPKAMLEIGVLEGKHTYSLLKWCVQSDAVLVSVDAAPWEADIPASLKKGAEGFVYKRGSDSERAAIKPWFIERIFVEGLEKRWTCEKNTSLAYLFKCSKNFDVVFVDGDHNYYTVLHELRLLSGLLNSGGLIFIHDISNPSCARRDYYYDVTLIPEAFRINKRQGILSAIEDFTGEDKEFIYQEIAQEHNGLGLLRKQA